MKLQRKTTLLAVFSILVVCVGIVLTGLIWYLPNYLEAKFVPQLVQQLGLNEASVPIRRVGLRGMDLGPIFLTGDKTRPPLEIASIQVDYSLKSLWDYTIDAVVFSGLQINVDISNDQIYVNGLKLPMAAKNLDAKEGKTDLETERKIPVTLERVQVKKSVVVVQWRNRTLRIPFELNLGTRKLDQGLVLADLQIYPRGNAINIETRLNISENQGRAKFSSKDLLIDSFADFFPLAPNLDFSGNALVEGKFIFDIQPFDLTALNFSALLTTARILAQGAELKNSSGPDGRPQPIRFDLKKEGAAGWHFECAALDMISPVPVNMRTLQGTIEILKDAAQLTMDLDADIPAEIAEGIINGNGDVTIKNSLPVKGRLDARYHKNASLDFDLRFLNRFPTQSILGPITYRDIQFSVLSPTFQLKGQWAAKRLTAEYLLTVQNARIGSRDMDLKIPSFRSTGKCNWDMNQSQSGPVIHMTSQIPDITYKQGPIEAKIPQTFLTGSLTVPKNKPFGFSGELQMTDVKANHAKSGIAVHQGSINLPLRWPLKSKIPAGKMRIKAMSWQKRALGSVDGTIQLKGPELLINARHRSKLLPALIVNITGEIDRREVKVKFNVPTYQPAKPIDLASFAPAVTGFKATGRLDVQGEILVSGQEDPQGTTHLQLNQGAIFNEDQKLAVEGISMDMKLDDLLAPRSAPRQRLRVQSLSYGDLNATNFKIDFQIEPQNTFYIEQSSFNWCRGTVNTQALRISPGTDDYDVTLFCDRLNLAMVLDQFGAAEARGEGTVNGRIPLHFSNGRIFFQDGFLYSTPGGTGTIHLKDTEFLLAGLPPGSPQHVQLDIAIEALKAYAYKWARMSLVTEGDDLLLKLQFDGKPLKPLPFVFDRQTGQFTRFKGEGQSEFEGIRLDINFRLPLDKILQYKDLLKLLQ